MFEKESGKNQTSPITPGLQLARPGDPGGPAMRGGARPGAGRPKGVANKITNTFRDLLLQTATRTRTATHGKTAGIAGAR